MKMKIAETEEKKRAEKIFNQHFQEAIDRFEYLEDGNELNELMFHELVWLSKISAVISCELVIEISDHLTETYWRRVINEIYKIEKPTINKNNQN